MKVLIIRRNAKKSDALEMAFGVYRRYCETRSTTELREEDMNAADIIVIVTSGMTPTAISDLVSRARGSLKGAIIVLYKDLKAPAIDAHDADWLIQGNVFETEFLTRLLSQGKERAKRPVRTGYDKRVSLLAEPTNHEIRELLISIGFAPEPLTGKALNAVFVSGPGPNMKESIAAAKSGNPKAHFIGLDKTRSFQYSFGNPENLSYQYSKAGCDYFFNVHQIDINFLHQLVHGLQRGARPQELMYGFVGSSDTFEQRARQTANTEAELGFLLKELRRHGCETVLDAGCGSGRLAIPLAETGFRVLGIDLSEQQLAVARSRTGNGNNPRFLKANLAHTGLESDSFDAVILMWHVLAEFSPGERKLVLREMLGVLRPPARRPSRFRWFRRVRHDGILIFDFPDNSNLYAHDAKGDPVGSTLHYYGNAPSLEEILQLLREFKANILVHRRVQWGVAKHVFVVQKWGWH